MRAVVHAHLQHTSEVTGSGIVVSVIVANARSRFLGHSIIIMSNWHVTYTFWHQST